MMIALKIVTTVFIAIWMLLFVIGVRQANDNYIRFAIIALELTYILSLVCMWV